MKVYFIMVCLSLIFLSACQIIPSETAKPMEVLFCYDTDCRTRLVSLIEGSKDVVCALYDLDKTDIVDALNRKNALIVLERQNRNKINNMLLHKKYDDSKYLMHNKFCVFDGNIVWTGSWNPVNSRNQDNVLIIYSKYLAQNYKKEFNELWSGDEEKVLFPDITLNENKIQNYFCPEDECAANMLKELEKSKESIYFMLFSFTDDQIGTLLLEKANQGIKVKGIIEKGQLNEWSEFEKLKEYTVFYNGDGLLHHKVFVIDHKTVISGSYNPTQAGNSKNDENLLIIEDETLAKLFFEEFDMLYNQAHAPWV